MPTATKTQETAKTKDGAVSWAQFGLETASDIQKQWLEAAAGFGELALEGAKTNLKWMEHFYGQVRETAEKAAEGRNARLKATIDRFSK